MLKNGHHKESFIYGAYSEDVFINFNDDALSMKIERYYKDEESKINFSETIRKVRLVGFDLKIAL